MVKAIKKFANVVSGIYTKRTKSGQIRGATWRILASLAAVSMFSSNGQCVTIIQIKNAPDFVVVQREIDDLFMTVTLTVPDRGTQPIYCPGVITHWRWSRRPREKFRLEDERGRIMFWRNSMNRFVPSNPSEFQKVPISEYWKFSGDPGLHLSLECGPTGSPKTTYSERYFFTAVEFEEGASACQVKKLVANLITYVCGNGFPAPYGCRLTAENIRVCLSPHIAPWKLWEEMIPGIYDYFAQLEPFSNDAMFKDYMTQIKQAALDRDPFRRQARADQALAELQQNEELRLQQESTQREQTAASYQPLITTSARSNNQAPRVSDYENAQFHSKVRSTALFGLVAVGVIALIVIAAGYAHSNRRS